MLRSLSIMACAFALAATGCSVLKSKPKVFEADLSPTAGNSVSGMLTFTAVSDGVHLQGRVTGLEPGSTHGFHIHEHGDCSAPDASSAGGHFNPTGSAHGDPVGLVHHAGDMANQVADAQGNAAVDVTIHNVSLNTGSSDDVLGRSVIVHRDPDDYTSQPAGNSGSRLACGVILLKK